MNKIQSVSDNYTSYGNFYGDKKLTYAELDWLSDYPAIKAVINAPREMLVEKADLEEETVDHVIEVLKAEFE